MSHDCYSCKNTKIVDPEACKACLESQINESTMKLAQEIQNNFILQNASFRKELISRYEKGEL